MTPIAQFCENKGIKGKIREAFNAYVRASFADRYEIYQEGDTVSSLISKMTQEDVANLWSRFILDLRDTLI